MWCVFFAQSPAFAFIITCKPLRESVLFLSFFLCILGLNETFYCTKNTNNLYKLYTVKPAFAATSIWRPPVHGGHPEVPPMHFTIYFTSIWQPPAQRGQRPLFCAKKAKMNLLSRPQFFFSAIYKEMSAIVKKKVIKRS